jgi:hypothetical protein
VKYEATCLASDHVPTPVHEAFEVEVVPTLRRWLQMPKGTALCPDWVTLAPSLDAAIISRQTQNRVHNLQGQQYLRAQQTQEQVRRRVHNLQGQRYLRSRQTQCCQLKSFASNGNV